MTKYQMKKEKARQEAIRWQLLNDVIKISYAELVTYQLYFAKLGKRYGLLKEFKENGII